MLAEIDPRDYQVAVDQAKAQLADAQATAQCLESLTCPSPSVNTTSQVSASEADVENARAGIVAAQQQYDAAKAQLDAGAGERREGAERPAALQTAGGEAGNFEAVVRLRPSRRRAPARRPSRRCARPLRRRAASDAGTSKLITADANFRYAQTGPRQVASTRARALSADATVQQRQAALEQAQLNLQYTKIIAPVDGVVTKNAEVGMNVQPGQQLFSIVPLADVWVTANFKETQLKYMKPGQPRGNKSRRQRAHLQGPCR